MNACIILQIDCRVLLKTTHHLEAGVKDLQNCLCLFDIIDIKELPSVCNLNPLPESKNNPVVIVIDVVL